jgi:hypothetical protein
VADADGVTGAQIVHAAGLQALAIEEGAVAAAFIADAQGRTFGPDGGVGTRGQVVVQLDLAGGIAADAYRRRDQISAPIGRAQLKLSSH